MIAENSVQEVIARIDTVAVVNTYVHLDERNGRYVGLCPFHTEKTPSFNVNPDKNVYYCFGCGKGGSIINFVMEMEKTTFPETIELLANRFGIPLIHEDSGKPHLHKEIEEITELYRRVTVTFQYWLRERPDGRPALNYLLQRGLSREIIEAFQIGFAPADGYWLFQFLRAKGYSEELLNQSGLFSKKNPHYSFFSSRIMFPITDRQGKIQAFGGRIFPEGEIKYLNSAESDRYRKGHNLFALYTALPAIRKTKVAVLAEGYMDVIALHQADVTNAVAPLGTSFTDDQAKILARSASSVRFFFDADSAGQDATIRGILTCRRNGLSAEVIVPEHSLKDPAEILQKFDANVLKKNADHAIIDRDYFVSCAQSRYGGNSVEHKAQAVAFLFPYLQALNSEVMRDASIEAVAQAFSINPKFVSDDYKQYTDSPRADHRGIPPRPAVSIHTDDELSLLFAFAANPELYPQFRSQLSVDDFENPDARDIFLVLEDCFRSGAGIEMDTLLSCIRSEPLRNMLLQRIIKGEYSINPELFITDSINRLIERKLRRRLEEVQREMKSCPDETPQQQEKLNEFSELRLEIERLKNIGK